MRVENVPSPLAVVFVLQRLVHFEMIPPARQLDTVVAEVFRFGADLIERQVSPLAGEQGDGTSHRTILQEFDFCVKRPRKWKQFVKEMSIWLIDQFVH